MSSTFGSAFMHYRHTKLATVVAVAAMAALSAVGQASPVSEPSDALKVAQRPSEGQTGPFERNMAWPSSTTRPFQGSPPMDPGRSSPSEAQKSAPSTPPASSALTGADTGSPSSDARSSRPERPGPTEEPVERWISDAVDVLRANGTPVGPQGPERLKRVAHHESSGDPTAVNDWDINAAKGTPSKGLMQTIRPTFEAYKLPGHDDIMNPVDNTIAATRYMFDRYGSIEQHPGIESLESGGSYEPY